MRDNIADLTPIKKLKIIETLANGARFQTEAGPLTLTATAPGVFRLRLGAADRPDYGIIAPDLPVAAAKVVAEDDGVTLHTEDFRLEIAPDPVHFSLYHNDTRKIASADDGHFVRRFRLPPLARTADGFVVSLALASGEAIYGLGEKYGPLNRRGQWIESWNRDALGVNAEISYKNCPFAWSGDGWGVFVHTPARVSHAVGDGRISVRSYVIAVKDDVLDLFLLAAGTPAEVLKCYTDITGRSTVPPDWSFGTWISRAYYKTADEAAQIAATIREKQFPCDVFTLDGRAWLDTRTRFAFEWDAARYPDPKQFTAQTRAWHFRLCVWEYPLVSVENPLFEKLSQKGWLLKNQSGNTYVYHWDMSPFGKVLTPLPASGIVDFTHPDAYAWYGRMHTRLFDSGIDIIKTDFGEQVPEDAVAHNGDSGKRLHNVYPLLYNRCVYEASRKYFGDNGMVWGRSGWAGSQRYPIQWGGDPEVSWEGLAGSIRGGLSWGLSGAPYYSHDIGGFYGGQPDPELYIRWLQAGVLMSHCRIHGIGPREPWYFGAEAETIARRWLEFRYQLLPYLLHCAQTAAQTGLPVMRAMPLAFAEDPLARPFDEQYMLGEALLVAPVLSPGGKKSVYLPAGIWFDYWTGDAVTGGRLLHTESSLAQIPLFVCEGTILPLGPVVQHTGERQAGREIETLKIYGLPARAPGDWSVEPQQDGTLLLTGPPTAITVDTFGPVSAQVTGKGLILQPL